MSSDFIVLPSETNLLVTACVGFIVQADSPRKLVIIKNKRGWDIPGGHVEHNETPYETLEREVYEETGCTLTDAQAVGILGSNHIPGTGIVVFKGQCEYGAFNPNDEVEDRQFVTKAALKRLYYGDKKLLQELLDLL